MSKKQHDPKLADQSVKAIFHKIKQLQFLYRQNEDHLIKLSKFAFSNQLLKALSPGSTFIKDHKNRLTLALKLISIANLRPKKKYKKKRVKPYQFRKDKKSHQQDLLIIPLAIKLFNDTNQHITVLLSSTNGIANDLFTSLLQQIESENKDTIIWLERILSNVTQPALAASS